MATKKEGVSRLAEVPLFSALSKRELGRLWDNMKEVHHPAGHVVMTEGKPGLGFQLIISGEVTVSRKGKNVTLGPGAFFGEMALIDGGVRTATVTAATDIETAALNSSTFKSLVQKKPDVMWNMLVYMTGRLRAEQPVTRNLSA